MLSRLSFLNFFLLIIYIRMWLISVYAFIRFMLSHYEYGNKITEKIDHYALLVCFREKWYCPYRHLRISRL